MTLVEELILDGRTYRQYATATPDLAHESAIAFAKTIDADVFRSGVRLDAWMVYTEDGGITTFCTKPAVIPYMKPASL